MLRASRPALPLFALVSTIASTSFGKPDSASPEKKACLDAYVRGQGLRDDKQLTRARADFLLCSNEACPAAFRGDCVDWLRDVDRRMPTAVFRVVDEADRDIIDARLSVDGALVRAAPGIATDIDPGAHVVRIDAGEGRSHEERLVFSEGEKNRPILFQLRAGSHTPRAEDDRTPSRPVPVLAYLLGGIGLAGLGGFAYLGITGDSDYAALERGCGVTGTCSKRDIDDVRTRLVVSNVMAGVGLAAIGAAFVVFLSRPPARQPPRSNGAGTSASLVVGGSVLSFRVQY